MNINIDKKIINKVENVLKKYPFWLLRIETGGLGSPSSYNASGTGTDYIIGSVVENTVEYEEDIKRKVDLIEKIYDLLDSDQKCLIKLRYFDNNNPDEVIEEMKISSSTYYNLRKSAFYKYALAFGYIKE